MSALSDRFWKEDAEGEWTARIYMRIEERPNGSIAELCRCHCGRNTLNSALLEQLGWALPQSRENLRAFVPTGEGTRAFVRAPVLRRDFLIFIVPVEKSHEALYRPNFNDACRQHASAGECARCNEGEACRGDP
jgi:hypothetical protein